MFEVLLTSPSRIDLKYIILIILCFFYNNSYFKCLMNNSYDIRLKNNEWIDNIFKYYLFSIFTKEISIMYIIFS